ncbi:MAG: hypothetical protein U0325_30170 [Polyangiales bacterium]
MLRRPPVSPLCIVALFAVGCAANGAADPIDDAGGRDLPALAADANPDLDTGMGDVPITSPVDSAATDGAVMTEGAVPVDAGGARDGVATPDATGVVTDRPSPCPAGQLLCDGACTLLAVDPRHCGACGQACAASERCDNGVCRVVCPAGQLACVGSDGAPACATVATDRAHCGACGNACPGGQLCAAGRCTAVCGSGETLCSGTGAATCADLQRDANHCGACGARCGPTERCELGRCVSRCVAPEVACDGACVNLLISDAHCGACGRRCADGQTCVSGVCRPRCVAPAVLCGDTCDDVTSSARNCGVCGAACPAGQSCTLGRCAIVCPDPQLVCNGRCFDLRSDRNNCGMCGRVCATGTVCLLGICTANCSGGLVSCDGACVDTRTSTAHCGVCGNACAARPGAAATCTAGRCAWTCRSGSGDCDGDATNGCETSLSSTSNCGACGNACRVTGSGIARCASGACGVTCLTGTADCDANYANGCEVDTQSSAQHCGACNRPCASGSVCVAGVCTTSTQVIESFDATTWPSSAWTAVGGGSAGTRSTTCSHDGAAGVQDPAWIYRTDVSVGASGQRLSLWVRSGGSGRAYMGFGATANGAWSLVAGFNTNELLLQQNASWGYTTLATTPWTETTSTWYRLELTFGASGAVTGRIYSATNTVLATVTATISGLTRGGVALRAFGTTCIDTFERR